MEAHDNIQRRAKSPPRIVAVVTKSGQSGARANCAAAWRVRAIHPEFAAPRYNAPMKTAVFSTKAYDRQFLQPAAANSGHDLHFLEPRLTPDTAILARGFPAICSFVNDALSADVVSRLSAGGTQFAAL